MNNSDVKNKIVKMLESDNNFLFTYIDGHGDFADIFTINFVGETYTSGYKCQINVNLNQNSGMWDVDVNGFNTLTSADNEVELEFAIRQQTKFSRTPCAEQVLAESQVQQPDESYY